MSYQVMKAVMEHRAPGVVPWSELFMDVDAEEKFMPELKDLSPREAFFRRIEFFDNAKLAPASFHSPTKVVERGTDYVITENESGTRVHTQYNPHFSRRIRYPVMRKPDLASVHLPDPDDPDRYRQVEEDIEFYSKHDFFIEGRAGGFFCGVWYNLRPLMDFLRDMADDPPFAHQLLEKIGEYHLRIAENLLRRGVHCCVIPEDMGMTAGPWFSPDMYEEYFQPWHERLADLCRQYNAYLRIHSHGNIMSLVDKIIATGVDILNPVGPGDNMDLAGIKAKYGERIVILGGMSKFIARMSQEEVEAHIAEVFEVATRGGGFIARNESGVPADMTKENLDFYIKTVRKYREMYGHRGLSAVR
ncbi:MAG: hypothetical protein HQ559_16050 [Lentisphaerae bacterium]|nr:hypothetical protein [Lentisphaerota bacterium]